MDDAVLLDVSLERGRGESGFGAIELEPAGAGALLGAALGDQRLVLGERVAYNGRISFAVSTSRCGDDQPR